MTGVPQRRGATNAGGRRLDLLCAAIDHNSVEFEGV